MGLIISEQFPTNSPKNPANQERLEKPANQEKNDNHHTRRKKTPGFFFALEKKSQKKFF